MKLCTLVIGLLFAGICSAKDQPDYQKGTLLRMDSISCGMQEKGSKTVAGEILGTDAQHKKTQELLCQKYIVHADRIVYRIRPKDDKHPALLPIGETAQFRIDKDELILRIPEVTPRQDKDTPAQAAAQN